MSVRADTLPHSLHVCNGKVNSMEMSPTCITLLCCTVSSTASTVADRRNAALGVLWGGGIFLGVFSVLSRNSVCALAICVWSEETQPSPKQQSSIFPILPQCQQ